MSLRHVYRKKDKRLLVLLALGALILFSDFAISAKHMPAVHVHSWLEIQNEESRLYRYESIDHRVDATVNEIGAGTGNVPVQFTTMQIVNMIKQGRAIALQKEQDPVTALLPASPRLAFFLGRPFSINIAEAEDLALIPGVGPVLAGNIIAYRDKFGSITEPSQLEDIPGIGPRMKLKLLNYLSCLLDCE